MFKFTALLVLISCLFASQTLAVSAYIKAKQTTDAKNSTVAPADECNNFKLTYPTKTNLTWTDDKCYKIKYTVNQDHPEDAKIYVSLMDADDEYVSTLVNGADTGKTGGSIPFYPYLGANPQDGDYYLSVKFSNGMDCDAKKTPLIHVTHNPNSVYPTCH